MKIPDTPADIHATATSRLIARQPLIDRHGRVAGWDLRLSSLAIERLRKRGAPQALSEACNFALTQMAQSVLATGQIAFMAAQAGSEQLVDAPVGAVIRISVEQTPLLAALRARATPLALPTGLPTEGDDYRVLDGIEEVRAAIHEAGPRVVAVNIKSFDDMVGALRLGARYCCGSLEPGSHRPQGRDLPPQALIAANLLSALTRGRAPREIAALFKGDVALSFRLLSIVNTPAFGLSRPVDSLLDAVTLMGARELHRWLCVLLLSADTGNMLAPALHEAALTRGRFFELVARARGETPAEPADALFMTGAFSLLDILLDMPLNVALEHLPLPEPAQQALLSQRGPWAAYLRAARALERNDDAEQESAAGLLELPAETLTLLWFDAAQWAAAFAAGLASPK